MTILKNVVVVTAIIFCFQGVPVEAKTNAEQIEITDAWVKGMPPSIKNTAAYMTIQNNTEEPVTLIEAVSDVAEHVEIHTMSMEDGTMRMKQLEELSIESHSTVTLEPGGLHIMIIGLIQPLKINEQVEVILKFDHGLEKSVMAVIKHPIEGTQDDKGSHKGSQKGSHGKGSMHE